jgi:thiol-disulfide isomerase/thioredoxin
MKKKNYYIFALLFIWLFISGVCVAQTNYHKLSSGEKVPDVTFSILKDGKFTNARLSDFIGKVVILDYWNIWCGSCIAAFPKLERIQEKYAANILVLPVSFINSKAQVKQFVDKRKGTEGAVNLPLAIFENTNNPLFQTLPTVGYPAEVWIDKYGNFLKMSYSDEVTEENVERVLKGGKLDFKSRSYQMNFSREKPLLTGNNGGPDTAFIYRSVLTNHIDSIGGTQSDNSVNERRRHLFYSNISIIELIKLSLNEGRFDDVYNQFVLFEGSEAMKEKIFPDNRDKATYLKWSRNNSYCYDLSLPPGFDNAKAFAFMKDDIDRFFGLKSAKDRREVDCLVLKRTDSVDRLLSKSKVPSNHIVNKKLEIRKRDLGTFLDFLTVADAPIMLEETGYRKEVDLDVNLPEQFNIGFLNEQLIKYGLKFEKAKRILPVIVVKE